MKIGLALGERLQIPGAIKGCDGTATYYSPYFLRLARAEGEEGSDLSIDGCGKIFMERGKELG
jgi:hypothetical protein